MIVFSKSDKYYIYQGRTHRLKIKHLIRILSIRDEEFGYKPILIIGDL